MWNLPQVSGGLGGGGLPRGGPGGGLSPGPLPHGDSSLGGLGGLQGSCSL